MSLIPYVREKIHQALWQNTVREYTHIAKIVKFLNPKSLTLDHFALIDLFPGHSSGISFLNQLFSPLGYIPGGRDYLPEKQNEFMWLTPLEAEHQKMQDVSPQIVIADFNPNDIDTKIGNIILKYTSKIAPFPFPLFHRLCGETYRGLQTSAEQLIKLILSFIDKPAEILPTYQEYGVIKEYNELLAWALVFGRKINHFGINVEFLEDYANLEAFNHMMTHTLHLPLNQKEGLIKGDAYHAIAQSSTEGELMEIQLQDKKITLQGPFMEFVWRASRGNSKMWTDYFTGFIGQQATKVVESVYTKKGVTQ